jgi:hypothetical protein
VTDLYGCQAQGWTNTSSRIGWTADSAERSAGSDSARGRPPTSMPPASTASRDPLRMPFAAYPLHPVACARLIGDIAVFTVETSGPALAESVSAAGVSYDRSCGVISRWHGSCGDSGIWPTWQAVAASRFARQECFKVVFGD